jgi:hypothetical protein
LSERFFGFGFFPWHKDATVCITRITHWKSGFMLDRRVDLQSLPSYNFLIFTQLLDLSLYRCNLLLRWRLPRLRNSAVSQHNFKRNIILTSMWSVLVGTEWRRDLLLFNENIVWDFFLDMCAVVIRVRLNIIKVLILFFLTRISNDAKRLDWKTRNELISHHLCAWDIKWTQRHFGGKFKHEILKYRTF